MTTPPPRKKLIEVALPLEAINAASAKEKNPFTKHHPRQMHLWWARRPLAACRAVLFASLVDDPSSDPAYRNADGTVDEERAGEKRAELFNLIEGLVKWENSNNPKVINAARAEIARCVASRKIETGELVKDAAITLHLPEPEWTGKPPRELTAKPWDFVIRRAKPEQVDAFLLEHAPPVLDPFCGGGSIPLEAQRLGLKAYGSDLNPVPVLINKALIELPPKFAGMPPVHPDSLSAGPDTSGKKAGKHRQAPLSSTHWPGTQGLAADVRAYAEWVVEQARTQLGQLYPNVRMTPELVAKAEALKPLLGTEVQISAWLWSRTIRCPNPACGKRAPLVRSFWLSTKKGKEAFAVPVLTSDGVEFSVAYSGSPPSHTTDRLGARCLFCDRFIRKSELREIAREFGLQAIPFAAIGESRIGRVFLPSCAIDEPSLPRPEDTFLRHPMTDDKRWFSPPQYGLPDFADLFTDRQLTAMLALCEFVQQVPDRVERDGGSSEYAQAVATYLALSISRLAEFANSICGWDSGNTNMRQLYARQAVPITWTFCESNLIDGVVSFTTAASWVCSALQGLPSGAAPGVSVQADAQHISKVCQSPVVSTDPPYYDNIGYADLADFFYVWMRRAMHAMYPALFGTLLTPKGQELIAAAHRHGGKKRTAMAFFEKGLGQAFSAIRAQSADTYPVAVYYAFKQAEKSALANSEIADATVSTGWETMLEGLLSAGLTVVGTWPIRTEQQQRSVASGTNALASSIVLNCRPRPESAGLASRGEFVARLRRELPIALRQLQAANIAPVDLAQAAIGPGMAVFSFYSKVIESSGERMGVRAALALINQVLDEVLAEQEGDFDADSRWALAWFEQHGFGEGEYGVAETLSKAKNTSVECLKEAGILTWARSKVRILKPDELPEGWNPLNDSRLTTWKMVHHLIRALESGGESAAAELVAKLGGNAETARELCYRLYTICERKKRASEAISYNALVQSWPEIVRLAREEHRPPQTDAGLFQKAEE